MRPAWAHGRNYDPSKLGFFTAVKAFTVGESLLGGPDLLGVDGPDVTLPATFTSCTISETTTVEDGLFVHRETPVCTVSATLPEVLDLEGQRLAVKYGGVEVFRGTLRDPDWTEQVDVRGERMPGNTLTKTYRVRLSATNGEEKIAGAQTPPRNFVTATDLLERIESWTGLPAVIDTNPDAEDFPLNILNIGQDEAGAYASWWKYVTINDQGLPALGETLRDALRLYNFSYRVEPGLIVLQPNNRWLAKVGADPLEFTDEAYTVDPVTGDAYQGEGHQVSYTSRAWGVDAGMWTDAARLTFTNAGEDFVAGPFRAGVELSKDTEIALGPTEWQEAFAAERTTRAIISTLPIKSRPLPATKAISTPLQSVAQLAGTLPGMAELTADGVTERVAVLGRTHVITPDRWTVDYEMGPHHLLDRESDLDPGMPWGEGMTDNGVTITASWKVPWLPPGVDRWWVRLFWTDSDVVSGLSSFDVELTNPVDDYSTTNPGYQGEQVYRAIPIRGRLPLGVAVNVWVTYSTNEDPGQGTPPAGSREGQPGFVALFTRAT